MTKECFFSVDLGGKRELYCGNKENLIGRLPFNKPQRSVFYRRLMSDAGPESGDILFLGRYTVKKNCSIRAGHIYLHIILIALEESL